MTFLSECPPPPHTGGSIVSAIRRTVGAPLFLYAVAYTTEVLFHYFYEADHALGVTGGMEPSATGAHPHIKDSVMGGNRVRAATCTPTPFDVMAIYALY